ncbi:hypothetical protein RQP46_008091 [Phenoliferia psychrophenolica]
MAASPLPSMAATFSVEIPPSQYTSPQAASSNALKRVASTTGTGLDDASSSGTSATRVDDEGDVSMKDDGEGSESVKGGPEEEGQDEDDAGPESGREKKRARRSDAGLEPVNYKQSGLAALQRKSTTGPFTLTPSLTAPNALPGPTASSRQSLGKKGSRNLSPGGRKIPTQGDDDSSGLSSIDSDDDEPAPARATGKGAPTAASKSGKPKRAVAAPPPKVIAAPVAPKARSKPAPKLVQPPSVYRFPLPPFTATSAVLAKLHVREFFIRFNSIMPSLSLTSRQSTRTARVILSALDEPERFWGPGADVNQRGLLEAALDLLLDDFKYLYEGPLEEERRAWLEVAIEEVAQAKKSASVEVAAIPWATVWAGLREGQEGNWDKVEKEWTEQRELAEKGGEKVKKVAKGEIGLEKRLACMCALIDLCAETQAAKKLMNNGIEAERAEMIDLKKQKAKLRADLNEAKQKLSATKPGEPTATPSKAAAVKAKWKDEVAKVTKEIKQLEKENETHLRRINHDMHLNSTSHRLRLSPIGSDSTNAYYIHAPTPDTPYPTDLDNDQLPMPWTVLIHGPLLPSAPITPTNTAPRSTSDEWVVVASPTDVHQLADWVESRAKRAKFDREQADEKDKDKTKPKPKANGKGKKAAKEDEEEEDVVGPDVGELVAALRAFGDFCIVQRAKAHEEPMGRRETRGKRSM